MNEAEAMGVLRRMLEGDVEVLHLPRVKIKKGDTPESASAKTEAAVRTARRLRDGLTSRHRCGLLPIGH